MLSRQTRTDSTDHRRILSQVPFHGVAWSKKVLVASSSQEYPRSFSQESALDVVGVTNRTERHPLARHLSPGQPVLGPCSPPSEDRRLRAVGIRPVSSSVGTPSWQTGRAARDSSPFLWPSAPAGSVCSICGSSPAATNRSHGSASWLRTSAYASRRTGAVLLTQSCRLSALSPRDRKNHAPRHLARRCLSGLRDACPHVAFRYRGSRPVDAARGRRRAHRLGRKTQRFESKLERS